MTAGVVIKRRLLSCLFLSLAIGTGYAQTLRDSARELDAEHQRGVELAREGRHGEALAVLSALLGKYPGYYPVERDIVVVTAWKGDCRAAIRRYEGIRNYPDPEPYLIIPVSDCLIRLERLDEAYALLEAGNRRWPDDPALVTAYNNAQVRRAARLLHELRLEAGTNASDQGRREWVYGASLSRWLADRTRVYARYANSRSGYVELQSGKQDRLGIGLQHEFRNHLVFTQEFSRDIRRSNQSGSQTSLVYLPSDLWRFGASHTNFAEDLPLRAKAQFIEAGRSNVFAGFHTADYRWSWVASGARYEFTDTNRRSTLFMSAGYAYEMKPRREQRVFLEYYESDNTFDNAVYFNPPHDKSVSVLHKTDFIYNSRFRRHVDHLYLSLGLYDQQEFSRHATWGVRYAQDYDFTGRTALLVGAGYARRVYDGAAEFETSLNAAFRLLF